MKAAFTLITYLLFGLITLSAQNPSKVFIQQAIVEYAEAVKQFTGDFITIMLSRQMALESFEELDSETNAAIVNQSGDNNISTLIQNGIGNMARID